MPGPGSFSPVATFKLCSLKKLVLFIRSHDMLLFPVLNA